ncbi:MAG: hypothetical protein H7A35_11735 [Planctomycetales bacterium]|nr:hypothetical protein [bacterium]UNM07529.1 MAG: hypothetical protein H7A35_11735 [Planctomycetales bacterium]
MRTFLTTVAIMLLCLSTAVAAEQPQSFVGQPDTRYRELSTKVYYYHAVINDFPDEDGNPAMPDGFDWMADLKAQGELFAEHGIWEMSDAVDQMDEGRLFYWRNSRFNCIINYDWEFINEPVLRSTIANEEAPYHSPVDHPAYGDDRYNYDGLFQIYRLFQYNPETRHMERVAGGGGFTWGADAETGQCGWSWYAAPPRGHYCGSDWLMVHEFGHQLDSLFEQSGHPELWFNHLAPELSNTARFGEHFDANSFILRRIRESDWEDLNWGQMKEFTDDDGDFIPLETPFFHNTEMPFDYFFEPYTDPDDSNADTDGDGVDDRTELLASNGNREGHGEVLSGHMKMQDPEDPDTDGDGLLDGEDPYPCVADFDSIPSAESGSTGVIDCGPAGADDAFSVELQYTLEQKLEIWLSTSALEWEAGRRFKLMLDLDNNGWFVGNDNYRFVINKEGIEQAARNICPESIEHPSEDRAFLDAAPFKGVELLESWLDGDSGRVTVKLTLDCELFNELGAVPGEMIGINAGIAPEGAKRFEMFTEPNTLLPVELRR